MKSIEKLQNMVFVDKTKAEIIYGKYKTWFNLEDLRNYTEIEGYHIKQVFSETNFSIVYLGKTYKEARETIVKHRKDVWSYTLPIDIIEATEKALVDKSSIEYKEIMTNYTQYIFKLLKNHKKKKLFF